MNLSPDREKLIAAAFFGADQSYQNAIRWLFGLQTCQPVQTCIEAPVTDGLLKSQSVKGLTGDSAAATSNNTTLESITTSDFSESVFIATRGQVHTPILHFKLLMTLRDERDLEALSAPCCHRSQKQGDYRRGLGIPN
ncbi:hypothetical protein KQ313_04610 [Synechococcus sp. CS-1325]|uniref:hypothetical protein n=1 Tax=unclassified Synechococcus TaxID=2626047 RepID=UPI0021A61CBD|nr:MULTISPECIES: hypothetical protein [unclassified Synechococcus]MCT0198961.1 hypothetical protein [Synechococcus sp. CS-1325]MCT0234534.1 hypothetical protein [Synechococcus sp. CS-1327]